MPTWTAARAVVPTASHLRPPPWASRGAANGTSGDILRSPGVPARLRGVLHRTVHLNAHAEDAPRQAGGGAVRAPHARPGLRAVWPAAAASGVRRVAAERGDVRHLARARYPLAGADGALDAPRLLNQEAGRRPRVPSPLNVRHSACSGRRVTGERTRGVRAESEVPRGPR